jgi:hypothetical protein
MENIAKAIIAVMKEVKGMEKNSKVGTGTSTYNGTKDQDVKEVFNEALAKNGLCILPISIEQKIQIDRWNEETQYGLKPKQSITTEVNTKYLLLHESGQSIELAGYGQGIDSQDKGAGKATTYALKNCLLYTFLTPVGKIDDTDTTHSEQMQTPPIKQTETTSKVWLNPNTKPFDEAIAFIKKGGTIEQIKKKYSISKINEELLINQSK